MLLNELTRQLKRDEGVRPCVYEDHLGWKTIGVGRLVDSRKAGAGLRPSEIDLMLSNDIEDRISQLTSIIPWFAGLDDARKGVLLAMAFQLGIDGLLGFKNTLALIKAGEYAKAADNMKLSKWHSQTPERCDRLRKQIITGEWQ